MIPLSPRPRAVPALLAVLLATSIGAARAECPAPTANADLVGVLEEATTAFGKLEIEAFQAAAARAEDVVACLAEPVSRPTAASYHRVQGLSFFLQRNSPEAKLSFAAARSVEPAYAFPTDLVPEGNPVRADYEAVDPKAGPFDVALPPKAGSLRLNGSQSMRRARPLPVIFQLLDGRGAVVETALVPGGAPLPPYDARGLDKPRAAGDGPSLPLLIGGGVALAAAGGLYAGALVTKGSIEQTDVIADLDGKRRTANTLVLASAGAGAVGVGLGVTSFLVSGSF
jgi:hypothetical protein